LPFVERSLTPQAHVSLAPLTTLGVGGEARWFATAGSAADVSAADRWCRDNGVTLFVLGGGSNLVIADRGVDGLVLQIAIRGTDATSSQGSTLLHAGAGESWDAVVQEAVSRGLAGLECLSGIPGSAGGTPVQNVGAYGQEVGATIADVTVFDRAAGHLTTLTGADCAFQYRMSRFKRHDAGRFVVCGVTFRLAPGPPTVVYPDVIAELARRQIAAPTLRDVRTAVVSIRRRKGMVLEASDADTRSVGSFFMNPVVSSAVHARFERLTGGAVPAFPLAEGTVKIPAAWLIERSGLSRGDQLGGAGISFKHPLAIVNRGGATARDVVALARRIKQQVSDRFGIWLRPEPVFMGFDDDPDVAYLQKAQD
jgi:UDP-N-acetylmuramate dehydrogenase